MPLADCLRLLILDDDEKDVDIIRRHLTSIQRPAYEVTHARNLFDARIAIAEGHFDAALIDYRLPGGISGMDVMREIGGRSAPFPIVLLTGVSDADLDSEALNLGAYDYVEKTALTRELLDRTIRFAISSYLHEKALRRSIAEATEQAAINSRILSVVSHEMKSPVRSLIGYCDHLIAMGGDPAATSAIRKMKAASIHLEDFLTNLSEFVRLDGGKATLAMSRFNLLTMLEDTVAFFEPFAAHKGIKLRLKAGPECDGFYRGDRLRIRQIVINLIKNAVSYSDEGVITLFVAVSEGRLKGCVSDQGVGISDEKAASLTKTRFSREKLGGDLEGGMGIGLPICARLLRMMNGGLSIKSQPGKGTRVFFGFDLAAAPEETGAKDDALRRAG
jgi:two-component system, sensor histidine kinase and response regulator